MKWSREDREGREGCETMHKKHTEKKKERRDHNNEIKELNHERMGSMEGNKKEDKMETKREGGGKRALGKRV